LRIDSNPNSTRQDPLAGPPHLSVKTRIRAIIRLRPLESKTDTAIGLVVHGRLSLLLLCSKVPHFALALELRPCFSGPEPHLLGASHNEGMLIQQEVLGRTLGSCRWVGSPRRP
jgi:hypothetical protein